MHAVFSRDELKSIADVMLKHENIMVVADEIYEYINFSGEHVSIAAFPGMFERTITVNGFSKGYAMTGWRVGYICAPLFIAKAVEKMQGQFTSGGTGIAQRAALARALLSKPDLLLLDEPLSNVDQSFKEEIQVKLKQVLTDLKITTIIVTHDSYEAFYLGSKCGIILDSQLKQYDDPYNVYHFPNSVEVVNFLNRGILIPAKVTGENSLESDDLGTINGNFTKRYPKGSDVQLLLQPEDLEHDDQSNLKLEVVDRKFRGTNFIYTLKTNSDLLIPVFVHSHHMHQHEIDEKFGIKRPINIDHIVCF